MTELFNTSYYFIFYHPSTARIANQKQMKNECTDEAFYLLGFNKCLEEVSETPGRQENELPPAVVTRRILQKLTMLWTHFFHHHLKRTVSGYLSLPC